MTTLIKLLATVGGIGYIRFAPGTWASLVAVFIFLAVRPTTVLLWGAVIFLLLVGIFIGPRAQTFFGQRDPSCVVIDELTAMLCVIACIPSQFLFIVIAFAGFRVFDIMKPFPIKKIENLPGGWGIMLDDMCAGLYTILIVHGVAFLMRRGL